MNTRETIRKLHAIGERLNLDYSFDYHTMQGQVSNIKSVQSALSLLEEIGLFKNLVKSLQTNFFKNAPSFHRKSVALDENDVKLLDTVYIPLVASVNALIEVLSSTVVEVPANSISIKLPPRIKGLDDLAKVAGVLNKTLSLPITHKDIGGKVEISRVENGSIWLIVAVGTPLAMKLIAGISWSSAVIRKKKIEAQIFQKQVQSLDIANEQKAVFLEAQKKQIDMLIEAEAKMLSDDIYKVDNREQIEQLKHSISMISEHINKGLEIHPSLTEAEEVKNLFPDYSKLDLIESRIKMLSK